MLKHDGWGSRNPKIRTLPTPSTFGSSRTRARNWAQKDFSFASSGLVGVALSGRARGRAGRRLRDSAEPSSRGYRPVSPPRPHRLDTEDGNGGGPTAQVVTQPGDGRRSAVHRPETGGGLSIQSGTVQTRRPFWTETAGPWHCASALRGSFQIIGKSRLVPLHSTTRMALNSYAKRRDAHLGSRCAPRFFVAERGGRLLHRYVHRVFWRLSREIGLCRQGDHSGPRVHDFRHRFAIQTLLGWYREGGNVEQQLPVLSTYLGHTCVRDTYWYLSACPELMQEAARRLDQRWEVTP